jgi:integral membrane sensor domain MASE1
MAVVALRMSAIPNVAQMAILALAYFVAAKASLVFAIPPGYATAVWLPSGIALAAVLLWGARCWPGLWLGAACANFSVNLSIPAALGIAMGNTLEALCAGWLVASLLDRAGAFRRPEDVFLFAVVAAAASALAATIGTLSLLAAGDIAGGSFFTHWYTWWQGDSTGILVVTPFVLAWAQPVRESSWTLHRIERAAFALLFAAVLAAVFLRASPDEATRAVVFLAFPLLAWAACRLGARAVSASLLAGTALAVWCTLNQRGPFTGVDLNEALLKLQAFTSGAALIALALGAFARERAHALRRLSVSFDTLDDTVRAQRRALGARAHEYDQAQALAHVGVWGWDSDSDRMAWSDELHRIHGLAPGAFRGGFAEYLALIDPRERERVRSLLHGARFEGRPWDAIVRIVRPDGTPRFLHAYCRVAPRGRFDPLHVHGFCVDVTERVRLEQMQAAQHEIALMLARAPAAEPAMRTALGILCEKLEFRDARYWRAGQAGTPGLAVRAWREQRAQFARAPASAMTRAFAFPVVAAGISLGSIELAGGVHGEPDGLLCELASAVGVLLGEYLGRGQAEAQACDADARLRTLARRLLDAQEAERRDCAAQLREGVARPLAAAGPSEPLAAVRQVIAQLRPSALGDHGLLEALRVYATRFERRSGIATRVVGAEEGVELPAHLESALFQIARDALDNVARHAQARAARVELARAGGRLALSIQDDGCGFAAAQLPAARAGGLARMRTRAEAIGAQLRIESSAGGGTRITVQLPG